MSIHEITLFAKSAGGMYRDGELVVPTDEKVNEMVEECRKLWEVSSKLVSLE